MPVLLEIGDVVCIKPSLRSPWYYGKYCLATEAPSEAKYTLTAAAHLVCMELWTDNYLSVKRLEQGEVHSEVCLEY
jgi:hypothetical protein